MLRCESLAKSFAGKVIFEDVSLELDSGVYALQGRNGIGKSTLLALLAGAQTPDAGEAWIAGASLSGSPVRARRSLSYVPDESPIYPFMTGRELFEFVAAAKKCSMNSGVEETVTAFALDRDLETQFGAMSLGTQKKFLLAAAWIGEPAVLLFDEPGDGLDSRAREFLTLKIKSAGESRVVLFASHAPDLVASTAAKVIPMEALTAPVSGAT